MGWGKTYECSKRGGSNMAQLDPANEASDERWLVSNLVKRVAGRTGLPVLVVHLERQLEVQTVITL